MKTVSNVWIVDDDRSIRWVLEKALEQEGISTSSFDSGDAALKALERDKPDTLISDIRMPGIDGLELLSSIQSNYPQLPVIIMTAHSDLDSAVASYQGGAFEYLPKPFDVDDAVSLVKRAVSHAHENADQLPVADLDEDTEIIGAAPAMQEVFRAIGRLSQYHRAMVNSCPAQAQPSGAAGVYSVEHGGHSQGSDRVGTFRSRKGRFHRCRRAA